MKKYILPILLIGVLVGCKQKNLFPDYKERYVVEANAYLSIGSYADTLFDRNFEQGMKYKDTNHDSMLYYKGKLEGNAEIRDFIVKKLTPIRNQIQNK